MGNQGGTRLAKFDMPSTTTARGLDALATRLFSGLILVGLYYLSYRYPFQINNSRSSPTYSDTPVLLQTGKYVIIAAITGLGVLLGAVGGRGRENLHPETYAGTRTILFLLSGYALVKGVTVGSADMVIAGSLLSCGFFLVGLSSKWTIDPAKLIRILSVFAVVAILVDAVQIYLFRTEGRLPALGYANSVSVRFGSVLDDPNGFAILVALILPIVAVSWRRHKIMRLAFIIALFASLVLTQSFTGVAAVGISFFVGVVALKWRHPAVMTAFLFGLPFVAWGLFEAVSLSAVQSVWETKAGSVAAHAWSIDALKQLQIEDFLGFGVPTTVAESSYVSMIASFGLPFTVAYAGLGVAAVARLHRKILQTTAPALHLGFYFFMIAYLIGSANMQFNGVFPLNLLYVLGVSFSLFGSPQLFSNSSSIGASPTFLGTRGGGRAAASTLRS